MSARSWRDWSCVVRLVVDGDDPVPDLVLDRAERTARDLMAAVERAASRFRADSELEAVNDAAPRLVPVSPLALTLVEAALDAARRTDGACDPTLGAQLTAWGYDADLELVRSRPAPGGVTALDAPAAGWRRVVVDPRLGRVGVPRGVRLDLGATAKAWTADEAARRVAASLGRRVLVEIGGDLAVAGPAGDPWRVRVAEVADGPGEVVGLTHGGVATSSTIARRWASAAGPAHHLLDPATGRPVRGPLRTATVWASSATEANALSTAALVWGVDAPARLAAVGASARLVDAEGRPRCVGGWPAEVPAA